MVRGLRQGTDEVLTEAWCSPRQAPEPVEVRVPDRHEVQAAVRGGPLSQDVLRGAHGAHEIARPERRGVRDHGHDPLVAPDEDSLQGIDQAGLEVLTALRESDGAGGCGRRGIERDEDLGAGSSAPHRRDRLPEHRFAEGRLSTSTESTVEGSDGTGPGEHQDRGPVRRSAAVGQVECSRRTLGAAVEGGRRGSTTPRGAV